MDQEIRNKLQRATQQVRRILEEEFAEQLEGTFDVLPDGTILREPGKHLDARQCLIRQKLVDAIEHIKAGGKTSQEAVDEYTREAAFTFLNRFVALRMLESRGLLQECVSKGDESGGFKEFCGLTPGLASLEDGGYQLYLECLFDELSVEVKVLFDRRDSASLLWPRRGALTELLTVLSQTDLSCIWNEDETIGWVYQYFNSREEISEMRDCKYPRNTRELAVRNQFFTPRYVVEFLTDNTLGRIWYEMQKGESRLFDECQYLVCRPSEVFLEEGQEPPPDEDNTDTEQDFSQEELLKKTVYIPHRLKKDPRDLKILDPACGSGHFLLYAFELLITIYEEAWKDDASAKSKVTGKRLHEDYPVLEHLHAAIPGLVLSHNLHGIDIDPRAAQIAALALWMRGQRAYDDTGVSREQRPLIAKSNIVCAEPMPGKESLLNEFIEQELSDTSEKRLLAQLLQRVFGAMELAGEVGSLLKIEEEISDALIEAKKQWASQPKEVQQALFELEEEKPTQREIDFDVSGITDETFWEQAEERIYAALGQYSERAEGGDYRRRLFSDDVALGFAFIDLISQEFDVVLMNPPFGLGSEAGKTVLQDTFRQTWKDLYGAFIERAIQLLAPHGRIGAITSSTFFNLSDFEGLRSLILQESSPAIFADLRYGVMDDALVPAGCSVLSKTEGAQQPILFVDARFDSDKAQVLRKAINDAKQGSLSPRLKVTTAIELRSMPKQIFAYWLGRRTRQLFTSLPRLGTLAVATVGLHTRGGDELFFRAWWEIQSHELEPEKWPAVRLGAKPQHFFRSNNYVVDWRNQARALKEVASRASGGTFTGRDHYFESGLTYLYTSRTTFSVQPLEKHSVFTIAAHGLFPSNPKDSWLWLGWLNSEPVRLLTKVINPNRFFQASYVRSIPVPNFDQGEVREVIEQEARAAYDLAREHAEGDECSRTFGVDWATLAGQRSSDSPFATANRIAVQRKKDVAQAKAKIDRSVSEAYQLHEDDEQALSEHTGCSTALPLPGSIHLQDDGYSESLLAHISALIGLAFGRWNCDYWTGEKELPLLGGAFDSLPQGHRASLGVVHGMDMLVFDDGHPDDLPLKVLEKLSEIWADRSKVIEQELMKHLEQLTGDEEPLRRWIGTKFFAYHLARYSLKKRKSPIYWQLATASDSYSIWLYYHRFSKDTFFKVLNEYVKPKVDHERNKLERLRGEAGTEPTRSQRKVTEDQEKIVAELSSMLEEVERIAPLWSPNLNDGVIINFAPLWRLVPQNKSWQKECKKVWDKLVKGEYDWAHLAMHLWPERVVPKCVSDASLAIAHGLEDVFWEQDDRDRFQPLEEPQGGWEPVIKELVDERTSPAVKAALESLLNAPAPAGNTRSRRRRVNA